MKPTDVKSITYIRVFPTGGWVRRIPLPPTKTLIIPVKSPPLHCHLEKFRPIDSPSPTTQRLIPPLINNLHVITQYPPPPHQNHSSSDFHHSVTPLQQRFWFLPPPLMAIWKTLYIDFSVEKIMINILNSSWWSCENNKI